MKTLFATLLCASLITPIAVQAADIRVLAVGAVKEALSGADPRL